MTLHRITFETIAVDDTDPNYHVRYNVLERKTIHLDAQKYKMIKDLAISLKDP